MDPDLARRLATELDAYEAMLGAITELSRRNDTARLHELVRRRRDLSTQIQKVRGAGLAAFSYHPVLLDNFRSRLSRLQSQVLLLQADWPAVSINDRLQEYGGAAKTVAQANREFIEWLRGAMQQAK